MSLTESLIELFSRGGHIMFGIAGVSLVAWYFSLRIWLLAGFMLKRIRKMNLAGYGPCDLNSSKKLPKLGSPADSNTSDSSSPDLVDTSYDLDCLAIKAQTVRLGSNLWLVGTLAAVLPLLGLLGTVLGMLLSFEVIQSYGTSQPHLLAGGIGQALITTQAGLWTAVPVFFFHHIIRRRVRLIRNEIEVLFHVIQTMPGSAKFNGTSISEIRRTRHTGGH